MVDLSELLKKIQQAIDSGVWNSSNLQDDIIIPVLVETLARQILNINANYQINVRKTHVKEDSEYNVAPMDLLALWKSETYLVIKIQLTGGGLCLPQFKIFGTQYYALYPKSSEHISEVILSIKNGVNSFSLSPKAEIRPDFMQKTPQEMSEEELIYARAYEEDLAQKSSEERIIKAIVERVNGLEEKILKTMNVKDIDNRFIYPAPKAGQLRIRSMAKKLAYLINEDCPDSREKSLAITKVEEADMWANAAIARNE